MVGLKRDVIYDLDASFAGSFDGNVGSRTSATIVSGWNHIGQDNRCLQSTQPSLWDNAYMCDQNVIMRRVAFANLLIQQNFKSQFIKVSQIPDIQSTVGDSLLSTQFTTVGTQWMGKEANPEYNMAYGLPFIAGNIYQIWWGSGIDFAHLSLFTSRMFTASDPGIIFVFNFTTGR